MGTARIEPKPNHRVFAGVDQRHTELTLRSVSLPPPMRLGNTGSLSPASPPSERRDRLTISGSSTWRTLPPLPVIDSKGRACCPRDNHRTQD